MKKLILLLMLSTLVILTGCSSDSSSNSNDFKEIPTGYGNTTWGMDRASVISSDSLIADKNEREHIIAKNTPVDETISKLLVSPDIKFQANYKLFDDKLARINIALTYEFETKKRGELENTMVNKLDENLYNQLVVKYTEKYGENSVVDKGGDREERDGSTIISKYCIWQLSDGNRIHLYFDSFLHIFEYKSEYADLDSYSASIRNSLNIDFENIKFTNKLSVPISWY